jgi:hypothetical protein
MDGNFEIIYDDDGTDILLDDEEDTINIDNLDKIIECINHYINKVNKDINKCNVKFKVVFGTNTEDIRYKWYKQNGENAYSKNFCYTPKDTIKTKIGIIYINDNDNDNICSMLELYYIPEYCAIELGYMCTLLDYRRKKFSIYSCLPIIELLNSRILDDLIKAIVVSTTIPLNENADISYSEKLLLDKFDFVRFDFDLKLFNGKRVKWLRNKISDKHISNEGIKRKKMFNYNIEEYVHDIYNKTEIDFFSRESLNEGGINTIIFPGENLHFNIYKELLSKIQKCD